MAEEDAGAQALEQLNEADATELATLVGQVSDKQLKEAMSDQEGRKRILDEIFKRMEEHVEPSQVEGVDAIVHFKITDAPDGGIDVYEVVIGGGQVAVSGDPTTEQPRVAIKTGPVHFVKLVTGQQSGPVMFMTGKLKLEGDVMFASRLTSFFRIPTAAA